MTKDGNDGAGRAATLDVVAALIEMLPSWPAPDMLSECEGSLVIAWDLGDEIAGTVVGDQMISVFWAGYQEAEGTPEVAEEMLSRHVDTKWRPIETAPPFGVVEVRCAARHPRAILAERINGDWWSAGQLGLKLNWSPAEWRDAIALNRRKINA